MRVCRQHAPDRSRIARVRHEEHRVAPQEAPCPLDQQTPIEDPLERRDWAHLVTRLGLCALLVGFANEAVRTLYIQMGIASVGGTVYAFTQALVAFGVTAGAIAIALILLNSRSERMAKNCYHAIVVFLVIGALLLPLPLVYPDSSAYLPYAANAAPTNASACLCGSS